MSSSTCRYLVVPYQAVAGDTCISTWALDVMSAADLSAKYGDDCKIVAMQGQLWMRPTWQLPDLCDNASLTAWREAVGDHFVVARGGLFRQTAVSFSTTPVGSTVSPHPGMNRDWSDAGFLKTFQRVWTPPPLKLTFTTYNDAEIVGVCSEVIRDAYTVPAASSGDQPLYNVPAIHTNCGNFAGPGGEQCLEGGTLSEYVQPGWKRVSLNSRRTIHMHEDQTLSWFVDWANLSAPDGCGYLGAAAAPCGMHIAAFMKMKVQYG